MFINKLPACYILSLLVFIICMKTKLAKSLNMRHFLFTQAIQPTIQRRTYSKYLPRHDTDNSTISWVGMDRCKANEIKKIKK